MVFNCKGGKARKRKQAKHDKEQDAYQLSLALEASEMPLRSSTVTQLPDLSGKSFSGGKHLLSCPKCTYDSQPGGAKKQKTSNYNTRIFWVSLSLANLSSLEDLFHEICYMRLRAGVRVCSAAGCPRFNLVLKRTGFAP